jgi:glucose-6-phosphate isomerase
MNLDFSSDFKKRLAEREVESLDVDQPQYSWLSNSSDEDESFHETISFFKQLRSTSKSLVVIGVGGSSLGAKAILGVFGSQNVSFIDRLDDQLLFKLIDEQDLDRFHLLFISKSGNTEEVLAFFDYFKKQIYLGKEELFKSSTTVMTSEKEQNRLFGFAKDLGLKIHDFPADVSGRFSVFRSPGLIPIFYEGYNIEEFKEFYSSVLEKPSAVHLLSAALKESIKQRHLAQNFWSYNKNLYGMRSWLRQLISESLGKPSKIDESFRQPLFIECNGSADQHSYLQHVLSQPKRSLNFIFRIKPSADSTEIMHMQYQQSQKLISYFNRFEAPYCILEVEDNLKDVVSFFIIWMLVVQHVGAHYGLDTYGQEHIDELKRLSL